MLSSIGKSFGMFNFRTEEKSLIKSIRDAILADDEAEALTIVLINDDSADESLRVDPNAVADSKSRDKYTLLQLASKRAMFNLVSRFLQRGGNPNILTEKSQTCLHVVCTESSNMDLRLKIIDLFINWEGIDFDGNPERMSFNRVDSDGNTALHIAARKGYSDMCAKLIREGVIVSIVNSHQLTCCDEADSDTSKHTRLADMLELALLFQPNDESMDAFVDTHRFSNEHQSALLCVDCISLTPSVGMKYYIQQTITSFTEQIFALTGIELTHGRAEAVLNAHQWNIDQLLESFQSDANGVLVASKLTSATNQGQPIATTIEELAELDKLYEQAGADTSITRESCSICGEDLWPAATAAVLGRYHVPHREQRAIQCAGGHVFCLSCWSGHLSSQINDNGGFALQCAGYKCGEYLDACWAPVLLVEPVHKRWEQQRVRHIVDISQHLKLCPCNSCPLIVQNYCSAPNTYMDAELLPKLMACRAGHTYCLSCSDEGHSPCTCEEWKAFKDTVVTAFSAVGVNASGARRPDDLANAVWIATNTKKCPQCKSQIEKNEGCNHMTCRQCRHEFCWICMEPWRLHGSTTGGYFKCNRFSSDPNVGSAQAETERMRAKGQQTQWFLHHFTRFKAHSDSLLLESQIYKETMLRVADGMAASVRGELEWLQHGRVSTPLCVVDVNPIAETSRVNSSFASSAISTLDDKSFPSRQAFRQYINATFTEFDANKSSGGSTEATSSSGRSSNGSSSTNGSAAVRRQSSNGSTDSSGSNNGVSMLELFSSLLGSRTRSQQSSHSPVLDKAVGGIGVAPLASAAHAIAEVEKKALSDEHVLALEDNIKFLTDGFDELFRCRYFLRGLSVFSYFTFTANHSNSFDLDVNSAVAKIFRAVLSQGSASQKQSVKDSIVSRKDDVEKLQSELESMIEMLSDIMARRRLRASRSQVIQATKAARSKRIELEYMLSNWLLEAKLHNDDLVANLPAARTRHTATRPSASTLYTPSRTSPRSDGTRAAHLLEEDELPAAVPHVAGTITSTGDADVELEMQMQLSLLEDMLSQGAQSISSPPQPVIPPLPPTEDLSRPRNSTASSTAAAAPVATAAVAATSTIATANLRQQQEELNLRAILAEDDPNFDEGDLMMLNEALMLSMSGDSSHAQTEASNSFDMAATVASTNFLENDNVAALMGMGFSRQAIVEALAVSNDDMDRALEYMLSR